MDWIREVRGRVILGIFIKIIDWRWVSYKILGYCRNGVIKRNERWGWEYWGCVESFKRKYRVSRVG